MIAECGLCGKKRQTVMGYEFYGCWQDCGALCEDCARDVLTLFTASHAVVELIMGRALIDKCEKCAYESARGDCGANPPDCLDGMRKWLEAEYVEHDSRDKLVADLENIDEGIHEGLYPCGYFGFSCCDDCPALKEDATCLTVMRRDVARRIRALVGDAE